MKYQINIKKILWVFIFGWAILLSPHAAHASGAVIVGEGGHHHHHGRYAEIIVSGDRYYYDEGVFYTGAPDNYVVVEAPVGAVIYDLPIGYERIVIDDSIYFRYHDVYYRHRPWGRYEVVRVKDFHDRGRHRGWDHDKHDYDRHH